MKQPKVPTKDDVLKKYHLLFSKICKRKEDYLIIKTTTHNRAMRQLITLEKDISGDLPLAEEVYGELQKNEDEYIRWHAAARSLHLGILVNESLKVLDDIIMAGDPWMIFHAKRTLRIWRGEIDPTQPDF